MRTNSNHRESLTEREIMHPDEVYGEDHWTVLDFKNVDRVFATGDEKSIRIDLDGYAAPSRYNEFAKPKDNVNISAWMGLEKAKQLRDQLDEIIENID